MPLIRIDYSRKERTTEFGAAVGRVVHDALVGVGVPRDDRFQIITPHAATDIVFDAGYLGIARTDALVFIQITWNEGRTVAQKKTLFAAIADGLQREVQLRREDVFINLVEVKKENWSFGNGVAQYAE